MLITTNIIQNNIINCLVFLQDETLDYAQKHPAPPSPPQLLFPVESNNNNVIGKDDDTIEREDGLFYERRRRSVRKSKKFPKYTHISRGRNNHEADISGENVVSTSKADKSKLFDTTSTTPHHKPYTPFFLAHRFTVDCGYGVTPSPSYAKDMLSLLIDDIAGDLTDAARVIRRNTMEKLSMAADYTRLLSLGDLQSLSRNIFENTRYPEYETHAAIKRCVYLLLIC